MPTCQLLGGLQVPKLESDFGEDAARFLSQATGQGKRLTARIERKERQQPQQGGRGGRDPLASQPLLHVILFKEGSSEVVESVNADLLRAGFARVKVPKNAKVNALVRPLSYLPKFRTLASSMVLCQQGVTRLILTPRPI